MRTAAEASGWAVAVAAGAAAVILALMCGALADAAARERAVARRCRDLERRWRADGQAVAASELADAIEGAW